jgi:hypothetical protein
LMDAATLSKSLTPVRRKLKPRHSRGSLAKNGPGMC